MMKAEVDVMGTVMYNCPSQRTLVQVLKKKMFWMHLFISRSWMQRVVSWFSAVVWKLTAGS